MGYQVCPLPTAILSAHSEYKDFRSFDLTDQMQGIIDHWKELDLHFDALYSGYLASEKQMNIVSGFFDDFSQDDNFILVDPVLGDHGKLYPGMDTGMITGMRELCKLSLIHISWRQSGGYWRAEASGGDESFDCIVGCTFYAGMYSLSDCGI